MIHLRQRKPGQPPREIPFTISIFPDHTSQVWKVALQKNEATAELEILWLFEKEAELMHVLQLTRLLKVEFQAEVSLEVPYLPYARQDKPLGNETTWALHLFADLLKAAGLKSITTFDQHSPNHFTSRSAEAFHGSVLRHDLVCFPDKGARARYPHLHARPYVYFDKVRDQLTGKIEGLALNLNGQSPRGKSFLIVDDLCDAGGTFVRAAALLAEHEPARIDLCVSHGLFSKGRQVLHDAGIREIFTTNSLPGNPDGFRVWS